MANHSATSRPEPLLTRAGVVSVIGGLVSLLVTLGLFSSDLGNEVNGYVETIVGAVFTIISVAGPLVHAIASRGVVTPLADPVDAAGNQLVPAGSPADVTADVADALAEADSIYPAGGSAA